MVGWVAPSVHVADRYRSGGGQGAARTLPERRLCLYGCGGHYLRWNVPSLASQPYFLREKYVW